MQKLTWKTGLMTAVCVLAAGGTVWATERGPTTGQQKRLEATVTPPPDSHEHTAWEDMWDTFHNPTPYLSMGLDFRFRSVWAENIQTLNDREWEYQRYRTRWSTKWNVDEDVDLNTRLTWEFRTWDEPPGRPRSTDFDEVLFDHFNVALRNLGGMPLSATIGRQDIILGGGWLVLDGTPLDGSRTIFIDAARFTYDWADASTKVDMIYVDNAAESDRWLKPICDKDRGLTSQDERGLILWLTNKSLAPTQLEGWFIYKNDNPVDNVLSNFPTVWSRKAEIFTLGGAVSGTPGEHWKYRVEAAFQTGTKHDPNAALEVGPERDLEAYGGIARLDYLFKDPHNQGVHVAYEYASGDDPGTDDNEQFDLLWGKWPRWSELYIYTYSFETMIADSTNLHRLNVGHTFQLNKQWSFSTDYHALWADENSGALIPALINISPSDKFRGHLVTLWAKYKFTEQLKGHLLGEYFNPGDYYVSPSDDDAYFLRINVEYTF